MHKTTIWRTGAAVAALMALASCATLNEEQCASVEWRELGRQDGIAGRNSSYLELHQKACSKHGIPVGGDEWRIGWETGIRQYCTAANGLGEGRAGRSYANSCPAELAADFEGAYQVGKRLHDAEADRTRIQNEIDALLAKMRNAESREEKRALRLEIDIKRDALFVAEGRLRDAERALDFYVISNNLRR